MKLIIHKKNSIDFFQNVVITAWTPNLIKFTTSDYDGELHLIPIELVRIEVYFR